MNIFPTQRKNRIELYLRNVSTLSAKYPYLSLQYASNLEAAQGISIRVENNSYLLEGGADIVIHPGTARLMGFSETSLRCDDIAGGYLVNQSELTRLNLSLKFGCYDSKLVSQTLNLSQDEILNGIPKLQVRRDS